MNLDLLAAECNPCRVVLSHQFPCCEPEKDLAETENWKRTTMLLNIGGKPQEHQWLDQRIMGNLPLGIKKGKHENKLGLHQEFDLM